MKLTTLFLTIIVLFFSSCSENKKIDTVKIGVYNGDASLLPILAFKKKIFEENNLQVELKYYVSGKAAMDAMLKNEVDLATCTDFVVAKNSFFTNDFKILASIANKRDTTYIYCIRT